MAPQLAWGKPVKTFTQRRKEIERCNDLRARIKTYCKQESMTQQAFGEKIGCSQKQMCFFMTGAYLSGSAVCTQANSYLKYKKPLSKCTEEREKIVNNHSEI